MTSVRRSPGFRVELDRLLVERTLAGTARAGAWSRGQARRRQIQFLHDAWRRLSLIVVSGLALTPVLLLFPEWSRSFAAGAWIATIAWVVVQHVVLSSGSASLVMGEAGEIWTAQEMRRPSRRRWKVINRVILGRGDIDHVALGSAGVVVLETKWSAVGWPDNADARAKVDAAVAQVQRNSDRIRGFIRPELSGAPTYPAVILWGSDEPPGLARVSGAERDGVPLLRGRDLQRWLDALPDAGIDRAAIEAVWRRIADQTLARQSHDELRQGVPPMGLNDYFDKALQIVLGATSGFLAAAVLLAWLDWKLYLVAAVVIGGLELAGAGIRGARLFARSALVGSQSVTALIVGALLVDWLHPR